MDALAVMAFVQPTSADGGISAADAVFLFEHFGVVCGGFLFQILLIDTKLALRHAAAAGQHRVNILLRDSKSGGCFCLRFHDGILLFLD